MAILNDMKLQLNRDFIIIISLTTTCFKILAFWEMPVGQFH